MDSELHEDPALGGALGLIQVLIKRMCTNDKNEKVYLKYLYFWLGVSPLWLAGWVAFYYDTAFNFSNLNCQAQGQM